MQANVDGELGLETLQGIENKRIAKNGSRICTETA